MQIRVEQTMQLSSPPSSSTSASATQPPSTSEIAKQELDATRRSDQASTGDDDDDGARLSKKKRAKLSPTKNEAEVIDLLNESSGEDNLIGSDDDDDGSANDGFVPWDDDDWEGPASEVADETMYAVIRACPNSTNESSSLPPRNVKVLAVFKTKAMAEERAEGIISRLDAGGQAHGMIPGGTTYEDEVMVWVQEVKVMHD